MTQTDVAPPPSAPTRRRSLWIGVVVASVVVVPALVFAAVWISYKKPWLMDDYRSGYSVGAGMSAVAGSPEKVSEKCAELMAERYGGPPKYDQYITSEPASAFWWGCVSGTGGGENDWWNVSGYLTA